MSCQSGKRNSKFKQLGMKKKGNSKEKDINRGSPLSIAAEPTNAFSTPYSPLSDQTK